MTAVKKWYVHYCPYCDNEAYRAAIDEIKASIKEVGVRETKELLKEFPLLRLIKLYNGEYDVQDNVATVYVDFKKAYIQSKQYHSLYIDGYVLSPFYIEGSYNFVTRDQPIYNNYPLSLWIAYGQECEDCGTLFVGADGQTICHSCELLNQAMDYSTKAEDLLGFEELPKKKNLLGREEVQETLFGVELEYERVTAREVSKTLKGHAIAKSDGSIRSGVEVVTRPACIKTHKNSLKAFYDQVKVKAESNTGMHVHVDKSKLSQYQIGFMLQFLNDESLIADIEKVAGRNYSMNTYCKPKIGTLMTTGLSYDEYSKKIERTETDKYSPLNTKKKNTIEVRIFSSPESHEEMSAKLDFVNALVKYSSPYAVSVKSLADKFKWETFIGFVQANRKDFPDFVSYFLKGE